MVMFEERKLRWFIIVHKQSCLHADMHDIIPRTLQHFMSQHRHSPKRWPLVPTSRSTAAVADCRQAVAATEVALTEPIWQWRKLVNNEIARTCGRADADVVVAIVEAGDAETQADRRFDRRLANSGRRPVATPPVLVRRATVRGGAAVGALAGHVWPWPTAHHAATTWRPMEWSISHTTQIVH